jgi:peptidyl-prolyl cis-trans isomerase D
MAEGAGIVASPYGRDFYMFIAHGEWLRKYAPWILAGVLLLLLPGFILLFSPSASVKRQRSQLPTINGKPVNISEFQRARNTVVTSVVVARGRQPARTAQLDDETNMRAVQHLILLQKARELGIHVSDEELVRQIQSLPILLNEQKQFDPGRYQRYMIYLNNLGVSETQFEDAVREELILSRLRMLVGAAAKVTPAQLQLSYTPTHEETTIDYVEFNAADRKEPIDIKDDEAKAYYSQNQEKFRTPAMVKVRYVYFTISDARKSITLGDDEVAEYYERNKDKYVDAAKKPRSLADAKTDVKKDLLEIRSERLAGDRATGFSVKLVHEPGATRPDFAKIAADSGVTPHDTDFFDVLSPVKGVDAGLAFNQAAFALGPDVPFSDPVRGEGGYYVLEYLDGKPSQIPPFEEVKSQVIDLIKRQRALEATVKQGRELDGKVKDAVAGGKSFTDACATFGLKPKIYGPFTLAEETTNFPYASQIKPVALGMATNAVSDFIPTSNGGLFFHLKQRTPPKPEDFEKEKNQFEAQLLEQNAEGLFQDWANSVLRDEHVDYKLKARPAQPQPPAEEPEPAPAPAS